MPTLSIKEMNTEKIRDVIRKKISVTKSEIAAETGLSFPTVTRLVEDLCHSNELLRKGQGDSTGGRCASLYSLNFDYAHCLLIQVETSYIAWSVKDLGAEKINSGKIYYKKNLLENLDDLIRTHEQGSPNLKAIVIGISAMVAEGTIEETHCFYDIKGLNLPMHFKNLTDIPVEVHNDMNLTAIGHWAGSKYKVSSAVSLYWGEVGIGAGLVINGKVWRGHKNFSGELTFLPSLSGLNIENREQWNDSHIILYYGSLIRLYTCMFNPELVILYNNHYIAELIGEIRKDCLLNLPKDVMPQIEVSDNFNIDYENGLYALAQKIMYKE